MLLLSPKNFRGTLTKDLNCAKPLHEKCLKAGANGKQILNKFGFWETKTVCLRRAAGASGPPHLFRRQVRLCSACQCSCWHLMEQ